MQLLKVVEGKHNGQSFRYEDGFLKVFNHSWDKDDIKTIVEIANLLSVEGYNLKVPTGKSRQIKRDMFGYTYEFEGKSYDEVGE